MHRDGRGGGGSEGFKNKIFGTIFSNLGGGTFQCKKIFFISLYALSNSVYFQHLIDVKEVSIYALK